MCDQVTARSPYASSADVLEQCGFKIYPLQSVATDANGMRVHAYLVNGDRVTHTVPPDGFNFADATPQQLVEFHLPPRPSDQAALTGWTAHMRSLRVAAAPPFLASHGVSHGLTSKPWSGYMNTSTYNQYGDVYIDYYESTATFACTGDALSEWAGIGGWYTTQLAQAGTDPHVNGSPDHQDWFEVLPADSIPGNLIAHGGDRMQVEVTWQPSSPSDFFMEVYDATTTYLDFYTWSTTHWDGRSAEYIAERPKVNGILTPMRNFGTWYVNAGQTGADSSHRYGMQTFPLSSIASVNSSGTVLATPGANSGQSFQDYWQRCG